VNFRAGRVVGIAGKRIRVWVWNRLGRAGLGLGRVVRVTDEVESAADLCSPGPKQPPNSGRRVVETAVHDRDRDAGAVEPSSFCAMSAQVRPDRVLQSMSEPAPFSETRSGSDSVLDRGRRPSRPEPSGEWRPCEGAIETETPFQRESVRVALR